MAALTRIAQSTNNQLAETSFSDKLSSPTVPKPQTLDTSAAPFLNGRVSVVKGLPRAVEKGCLATITDILTNHLGEVELPAIREALTQAAAKGHEKIVHYLLTTFPHLFPQLDHEKAWLKLKEVKFEQANKTAPSDCVLM